MRQNTNKTGKKEANKKLSDIFQFYEWKKEVSQRQGK